MYVPIWKFKDVFVFEIFDHKPFVPHSLGVVLTLASKYELDTIIQYWVIAIFNRMRYVTLWPWPLTFWPWSHVTWCHLGVQSLYQVWSWTGYDLPFKC